MSFLSLYSLNSQSQNFDLGIKGGINYASISEINAEGRLGFTGGIFAGVRFNALALQT
ncbi:PorT family protein, partial [Aquimarina celericrescens]|nr:PorT family protein [Aquimarina celericrescens]